MTCLHTRTHTRTRAQVAADMATLVAEGINSFKFFMAYKVRGEGREREGWRGVTHGGP